MIYGRQNILEWFKSNGKPYFSIFRKNNTESGNTVFNNKDRENESIETAAAYLDKCLGLVHSGDFFIFCCKEQGSSTSKGRSETTFTLSSGEVAVLAPQAQAISGVPNYEVMIAESDKRAEDRFQRLMIDYELKQLKEKTAALEKENKELTAASAKPWNKLIAEVHPYIGSIAEQLGFKAAPIAQQLAVSGTPHDEHLHDNATDADAKMNAIVHTFCEALAQRYPDTWLTILQQLTATLQTSPDKIDTALKFL